MTMFERMTQFVRSLGDGVWVSEAYMPVREDPDVADWRGIPMSKYTGAMTEQERLDYVARIRWLCEFQPNVKRALGLYQNYVLGRGFSVTLMPRDKSRVPTEKERQVTSSASRAWADTLEHNLDSWSPRELGVRSWRDGESFTRIVPGTEWPPRFRFIDTERVGDPNDEKGAGIAFEPDDPTVPVSYALLSEPLGDVQTRIPAEEVVHVKIDVDSNVPRGASRFVAVVDSMKKFRAFVDNEVTHRNLQSSIVMHRKVKGTASQIDAHLDNLKTSTTSYATGVGTQDVGREKIRAGSIVTTNMGTEIEFKHPDSNFSDASPLARLLVAQTAAATGWPYFMLSGDSPDASYAGSLVQESPVVLMVQDEQDFFAARMRRIFLAVVEAARGSKAFRRSLPKNALEDFDVVFSFPSLVTRDGLKEAQATNIFRMAGGLSAAEVSRRAGADPVQMQTEMDDELERGFGNAAAAMNPSPEDKTAGGDNATGTNQGSPSKGNTDNIAGQ